MIYQVLNCFARFGTKNGPLNFDHILNKSEQHPRWYGIPKSVCSSHNGEEKSWHLINSIVVWNNHWSNDLRVQRSMNQVATFLNLSRGPLSDVRASQLLGTKRQDFLFFSICSYHSRLFSYYLNSFFFINHGSHHHPTGDASSKWPNRGVPQHSSKIALTSIRRTVRTQNKEQEPWKYNFCGDGDSMPSEISMDCRNATRCIVPR